MHYTEDQLAGIERTPLTVEQLKDEIRYSYQGDRWGRLRFVLTEAGHAAKNVSREYLRDWGFPESPGSKQNWVDRVALVMTLLPLIPLLVMIFSCPL